jgi:hypothetical protein
MVVIAAIAALIGVLYASFPRAVGPSANASATPTVLAEVTPSAEPSAADTASPTPAPSPTERSGPPTPDHGAPVATLRNPDGPPQSDFPPDGYPFFAVAEELPTFGHLWLDANLRDVHVALTGDVDGAIEVLRDGVPRGVTVYFYIVRYSHDELCGFSDAIFDDRDELMQHGILVTSGGCGNASQRVNIGLRPFTPEALAFMRARYAGPIDYEEGGGAAFGARALPEPDAVRLTAVTSEDALDLLTCGWRPFPPAALDAPAADLASDQPAVVAMRDSLRRASDLYGDLGGLDWILAESDEYGATFLADRGDTWLEAAVFPGRRGWVAGVIDYCTPRPLTLADGGQVTIYLDREYPPPGPATTELHVLLREDGCTGGRSPAGWLLPPVARYGGATLTLAVHARFEFQFAACPGNAPLPAVIELPEPLGERELRGISEPPDYP